MVKITVDSSKQLGKIKRMHEVGQPPFGGGFLKFDFSYIRHLKNANITYSRLHDVGGVFGGNRFVDIPNIFRDFDADETDPASYDFAFTDELLKGMYAYDVKPVFRLGVTIENQLHIQALRIHPPKDFAKWARICEHIIRHYNEGWANGFHYGIEYWEIWNEPDNGPTLKTNQMWQGTREEFFDLFDLTAKHLKACFGNTIKVGGYAACQQFGIFYDPEKYGVNYPKVEPDRGYAKYTYRVEFLLAFLEYARAHGTPMDFFSWHSYQDVEKTVHMDEFVHRKLCEYGYGDVEIHLNEWNNSFKPEMQGSSYASAVAAEMMIAMQGGYTDMMMYYDSRLQASSYGGFFAPLTYEPVSTYYAFVAFGKLYALGTQTQTTVEGVDGGMVTLSATNGEKNALMIVNRTGAKQALCVEGVDLENARFYRIDKTHLMSMEFDAAEIKEDNILLIEW